MKYYNKLYILYIIFNIYLLNSINSLYNDDELNDLLNSLTLEEKIGQLTQIDILTCIDPNDPTKIDDDQLKYWIQDQKIGSLFNNPISNDYVIPYNATEYRILLNKIQKYASETNSKIPILYGLDSVHGANFVNGATILPHQINMGATFNRDLVYKGGLITSTDTRAAGIPWIFGPILGIAHSPLWSRTYETFGEDTFLVKELGEAIISGLQYDFNDEGIPKRAAASAKHFLGYSASKSGHDRSTSWVPDRILREYFLPTFQEAIDFGVLTVMECYIEIAGLPVVRSEQYLQDYLRNEMGFDGVLVTDYAEIENLYNYHKSCDSVYDAVNVAMNKTSIDMSMVATDTTFADNLKLLVENNLISEERINESVLRILKLKNILGLFDDPIPSINNPLVKNVGSDDDRTVSIQIAEESIVLLKNEYILPLSLDNNSDQFKSKIFLTGPSCDSLADLSGGWTFHWQGATNEEEFSNLNNPVTILDGIQNLLNNYNLSDYVELIHYQGVDEYGNTVDGPSFDELKTYAEDSDLIITCLGEHAYAEKPGDIDNLDLPSGQIEYVENLMDGITTPLTLILVEGRTRLLGNNIPDLATSILHTFLPGPYGGEAIANILYGIVNPSGRMPLFYPIDHGSLTNQYYRKPNQLCTDPNDGFNYIQCPTFAEFGDGLSYSTFTYDNIIVSPNNVNEDDTYYVTITLTNEGPMDGYHTVLVFLTDLYRSITPEMKRLIGFEKIWLNNGESTDITFPFSVQDTMSFIGIDDERVLEDGDFYISIGHEPDCRSWTDYDNGNCALINLQTTNEYDPQCEDMCNIFQKYENITIDNNDNTYECINNDLLIKLINKNECNTLCKSYLDINYNYIDCIEDQYYDTKEELNPCNLINNCKDITKEYESSTQNNDDINLDDNTSNNDENSNENKHTSEEGERVVFVITSFLGGVLISSIFFIIYQKKKYPNIPYSNMKHDDASDGLINSRL